MEIMMLFKRLLNRIRRAVGGNRPPQAIMCKNSRYASYNIGEFTYGFPKIVPFPYENRGSLRIGRFCSIAENVTILLGGEHYTKWVSTYPFSVHLPGAENCALQHFSKGDVNIGNDVWLGFNATVLSGVIIGDGAVIGANSLVTKDIPPYAIAAGQPARVIKYRFTPEQIEQLLVIQWWNWPEEQVRAAAPMLSSDNIDFFLTHYSK